MTDYNKLIDYCKQLCLELTRVNNAVFEKDEVNAFDFGLMWQDNRVVEVKIYNTGCWDCSMFCFSYSDESCVYLNEEEIKRYDFVFGGESLGLMQKIFDELKGVEND